MTAPTPAPRFRLGARWAAAVFGLVVALLTAGIVGVIGGLVNDRASVRFDATADIVARSVQEGIRDTGAQLASFAALFEASDHVTDAEFGLFASRTPIARGVEDWFVIDVVPDERLDEYRAIREAESRTGGFPYRNSGDDDHPGSHYIVRYAVTVHADQNPRGYDLAGHPELKDALDAALGTGRLVSSAEIDLPFMEGRGFYLARFLESSNGVSSLVAAPVHTDALIRASLPSSIAEQVNVSLMQTGGLSPAIDPATAVDWFAAAGQVWRVTVTPTTDSDLLPPFETAAITTGAAGLVGLLAAFSIHGWIRRREAQRDLQETKRLNEARDQFLAAISHEIRTPLTAVVGFASETREMWSELTEEERLEMIRIIDEQAREVSAIVADLLVIGRTDSQSLHLAPVDVDVADTVRPAVESLPGSQQAKVTVSVDDHRMVADRSRTSQILRNLIVNACLHGGDRVDVRSELNAEFVHVYVEDNGDGIPEEYAQAVFDPYFSVTSSARPLPSVGLGLFVARRLAEAMGGSLDYRRHDGLTVFDLALPKADQPDRTQVG